MLLFLNSKGSRPDMTNEMIKSINETVKSLDNIKDQAEFLHGAAQYSNNESTMPFKSVKRE